MAPAAATPLATPAHADVGITLDVNDLDRSCRFYALALGFDVAAAARAGQIYEERVLRSPLVPHLALSLRAAFGKRATGGGPGSLLTLSLAVADAPAHAARLGNTVRWIGTAPGQPQTPGRYRFADPDGYHIELVSRS